MNTADAMLKDFLSKNKLTDDDKQEPWTGHVGELLTKRPSQSNLTNVPPTASPAAPAPAFGTGGFQPGTGGHVSDFLNLDRGVSAGYERSPGGVFGQGENTPPNRGSPMTRTQPTSRTNSSGMLRLVGKQPVKEAAPIASFPQAPPTPPPPPLPTPQQPPPPMEPYPAPPPPPEEPPAPTSPATVPPSPPLPLSSSTASPAALRLAEYTSSTNDTECAFVEFLEVSRGMLAATDTGDLGEVEKVTAGTVILKSQKGGYWVERPRKSVAKALLVVIDPNSCLQRRDYRQVMHFLQQHTVIATWSNGHLSNPEKDLKQLGLGKSQVLFAYTRDQVEGDKPKKNLSRVWKEFPSWSASDTLMLDSNRDAVSKHALNAIILPPERGASGDAVHAENLLPLLKDLFNARTDVRTFVTKKVTGSWKKGAWPRTATAPVYDKPKEQTEEVLRSFVPKGVLMGVPTEAIIRDVLNIPNVQQQEPRPQKVKAQVKNTEESGGTQREGGGNKKGNNRNWGSGAPVQAQPKREPEPARAAPTAGRGGKKQSLPARAPHAGRGRGKN